MRLSRFSLDESAPFLEYERGKAMNHGSSTYHTRRALTTIPVSRPGLRNEAGLLLDWVVGGCSNAVRWIVTAIRSRIEPDP
jgi:hypothetical protein